jgi:predicted RNA-binding protein with TRAM domain
MYSGEIEERNGSPIVSLPDRELETGNLEVGETYRIAVFARTGTAADATNEQPRRQPERHGDTDEPPVEEGELCEVEIEDTGEQGDGIARVGPGYVVFVSDTQVGDRVTVRITQARDNFAFAEVVEAEPVSG